VWKKNQHEYFRIEKKGRKVLPFHLCRLQRNIMARFDQRKRCSFWFGGGLIEKEFFQEWAG